MTDDIRLFKELTSLKYSMLKNSNLDLTKTYILYLLYKRKVVYPAEIISEINIKAQALANILKNMSNDNLIKREIDKEDKRKIAITLTKKGEEFGRSYCEKEFLKIKNLIEYLGEKDTKELLRLIERIKEYAKEI